VIGRLAVVFDVRFLPLADIGARQAAPGVLMSAFDPKLTLYLVVIIWRFGGGMQVLPRSATDEQILDAVHQWVKLLDAQEYEKAFALTRHEATGWDPTVLREFIEGYGDAEPGQRVTWVGTSPHDRQRIAVSRWPEHNGAIGEVWYDLNVNGMVSDITATFYICVVPDGLVLSFNDVHVM